MHYPHKKPNTSEAMKGNKNAVKADEDKVTGVGRVTIDLGKLKTDIVRRLKKGQSLKAWIVDACESKIKKEG